MRAGEKRLVYVQRDFGPLEFDGTATLVRPLVDQRTGQPMRRGGAHLWYVERDGETFVRDVLPRHPMED
jgi:hypothetical protein